MLIHLKPTFNVPKTRSIVAYYFVWCFQFLRCLYIFFITISLLLLYRPFGEIIQQWKRVLWEAKVGLTFFQYIIMIDFLYTIMCHFVPGTLLMLFEILLINVMSKNAKRKNMVNGSEQMKKKNNREKRLTQTTIIITLIDLIYEMSQTTRDVVNCANWLGYVSFVQGDLRSANLILQILYWIPMPSNFITICSCSKDFRQALTNMFLPFLPGTKQQPTSRCHI